MTRMTRPECAVMCNLINTHIHTHTHIVWRRSRLTQQVGTAEFVSRDPIFRRERGQGNINFPCSADHEQDCQLYLGDPYPALCDYHTESRHDVLSIVEMLHWGPVVIIPVLGILLCARYSFLSF